MSRGFRLSVSALKTALECLLTPAVFFPADCGAYTSESKAGRGIMQQITPVTEHAGMDVVFSDKPGAPF